MKSEIGKTRAARDHYTQGQLQRRCLQHALGAARWERIPASIRHPVVFISVALLWIPFRTEHLGRTADVFRGFLHWRPVTWRPEFGYCLVGLLLVFLAPNSHAIAAYCGRKFRRGAEYAWDLGGRLGWYSLARVAVAGALVTTFYRYAPDPWLRQHLPLARESDWVRNNAGDLRTNINRAAILSGSGEKWIFAGPSYTVSLGYFSWQTGPSPVAIGTIGTRGQSLENWIRTAVVALQDPGVRRLYIACSPVGLAAPRPLSQGNPFPSEGADALALVGIAATPHPASFLLGDPHASFFGACWAIASLRLSNREYFQLHGTILALTEFLQGNAATPKPTLLTEETLNSAKAEIERLWALSKSKPTPPRDLSNGSDKIFAWRTRAIIEAVSAGGASDLALGRLIAMGKRRGVRVILYETPTLKHHPAIYPAGYFDEYQAAMRELALRHGVEYVDLSGLLPEDGNSSEDFCHPHRPYRPLILQTLVDRTRHE